MAKQIPTCHPEAQHFGKGLCVFCYRKQYHNPKSLKWSKDNKLSRRYTNVKSLYELEKEDYNRLFENQNGQCAICSIELDFIKAHVDHNHLTKKVRGLLCGRCNRALGQVREDLGTLVKAIAYLVKFTNVEEQKIDH